MDLRSMLWGWDWESVPEWFGAVGTIAAVVVALAASWSSKAQLHQEREAAASERQEAAEDRQRFREQHDREMSEARRRAASRISLTHLKSATTVR